MSDLKETMRGLCTELRQAADANDMRQVFAVHEKMAQEIEAPPPAEEAADPKPKPKTD